jgi:transmembrane sensor
MNKYQKYNIEDFLSDKSFQKWVSKPAPETDLNWQNLLTQYPELTQTVHEAKLILVTIQNQEPIHPSQNQVQKIWKNINTIPLHRHITNYRWLAAASVVMFLGVALWWHNFDNGIKSTYNQLITQSIQPLIEVKNNDKKPYLVLLSDGSSVMLQANSRLSYPQKFKDDAREVYLEGEALFEIAKNSEQPFIVYANELVTKVLGTSFVVRAYPEQKNVEVLVKTGKVSVYRLVEAIAKKISESRELDGVVITPNQQIVFGRESKEFKKTIVAQPQAVQNQNFEFKNQSAALVLKRIQQAYDITIIYDENILASCPLTASLSDEPLYSKLDLICRAIGADYQVIDGQIVVNSKGCQ